MKKIVVLLLLFISAQLCAQKYFTRTGELDFKASVKGFEKIEAVNKSSTAILNASNGQIAISSLIKGFRFKIALMQEHFNERYLISDKFPKAIFKGSFSSFDWKDVDQSPKIKVIKGTLIIKGVSKQVVSQAKIYKKDGKVYLSGDFTVLATDYDIKIAGAVSNKVSNKVNISYSFIMDKKP